MANEVMFEKDGVQKLFPKARGERNGWKLVDGYVPPEVKAKTNEAQLPARSHRMTVEGTQAEAEKPVGVVPGTQLDIFAGQGESSKVTADDVRQYLAENPVTPTLQEAADVVRNNLDIFDNDQLESETDQAIIQGLIDRFVDFMGIEIVKDASEQTAPGLVSHEAILPVLNELSSLIDSNERLGKKDKIAMHGVISKLLAHDQASEPPTLPGEGAPPTV